MLIAVQVLRACDLTSCRRTWFSFGGCVEQTCPASDTSGKLWLACCLVPVPIHSGGIRMRADEVASKPDCLGISNGGRAGPTAVQARSLNGPVASDFKVAPPTGAFGSRPAHRLDRGGHSVHPLSCGDWCQWSARWKRRSRVSRARLRSVCCATCSLGLVEPRSLHAEARPGRLLTDSLVSARPSPRSSTSSSMNRLVRAIAAEHRERAAPLRRHHP